MAPAANTTVRNLDPYKVPWFADCAPSLLTNRTIRRYLDDYSQHTWPEVIKLTLIYGILGLEQQFSGGRLSIAQLRQLCEKGGAQLVVERNLPGLQRQILNLQTNLDAVFDRLAVEPAPSAAAAADAGLGHQQLGTQLQQQPASVPAARRVQLAQQQQQVVEVVPRGVSQGTRPGTALNPGPVAPKPPDCWRQGETTGFPSPPRTRDHPLRRSLDNQGATNPIYPDWWLAAGPLEPPPPKKVQHKVPRKQPRLAYSLQQQQQQTEQVPGAAADDLVTPEYLMVPGSGYGQELPGPVVGGAGPPVMLSSITPEGIVTTNTQQQATQRPAAAGPAAAAAGGGGGGGGHGGSRVRASGSKGPRRPQAAQSKIKEAVAASRRKATAQQQTRQQLIASAVAAGSSLFGAAGTGPSTQQQAQRSSTAAEAAAACASAAAADQFLSNPWTSCFLSSSALPADVCGFMELPSADIPADDEARLGALGHEGPQLPELQPPHAPAAYAVLQRVLAGQEGGAAAAAEGGSSSSLRAGHLQSQLQAAGLAPTSGAEAWLGQEDQQQQQQQQNEGLSAQGRPSTHSKGLAEGLQAAAAAAVSAGRSRGVFADITAGLNSQSGTPQGPWSQPAAAAAGPSSEEPARAVAWQQGCAQVLGAAAEDSQQSLSSADDWRNLPLVDDSAEQQQHQQHQQQQQPQRQAWACDFGHLEGAEAPGPKASVRQRRAAGKPHKRWSETWVGDFGHLQEFPRFARETAFQQQQQQEDEAADGSGDAPRPSSKLFMSPADLQALVLAADRLGRDAAGTSTATRGTAQDTHAARAAAAAAARSDAAAIGAEASNVELGDSSSAAALGDGEVSASSVRSLAARFAELLSRWDASAADSATALPAGVAARASVSKAAAGLRAAAAAAVAGADAESARDASAELEADEPPAQPSPERGSQGVGGYQEEAAISSAADATAALLLDLQQAVSELSAPEESLSALDSEDSRPYTTAGAGPQDAEGAAAEGVSSVAEGVAEAESSAVSLPAEAHLEGMQEASQMLQQALSRHDALMQLIAGLGGPAGSVSDVLATSTASGSELTL